MTGYEQLSAGSTGKGGGGPSVLVETLIGAVGALLVLAFVFASAIAVLPLLIAVITILTTFLLVSGMTHLTSVSFIIQFLVALVGLGVAVDYSLLIVTRWREELGHGLSNSEAIVASCGYESARTVSGVSIHVSKGKIGETIPPADPYARLGGMKNWNLEPSFMSCTPSVQPRMTPFSGNSAGSRRA